MRRLAALALSLTLTLGACGTDQKAVTQPPAPASRAAIRILGPSPARAVAARPAGRGLRASVAVRGSAAPGQQLTVRGPCGTPACGAIAFADSRGRWSARVALTAPRAGGTVRLAVAYAMPRRGERAAVAGVRLRRAVTPQAAPAPAPPPGPVPYRGPRTLIVIGDSLAVGMAGALRADLPGWDVRVDGRIGRPLAEGLRILARTALPGGARGSRAILAFSLFTNDAPGDVAALEAAVRGSLARLGAHGCAVWATIARPPFGGVSYAAANRRLEALAADPALTGRLLVVPWAVQYAQHPSWRAGDGVHATPEGYAARAQLYAAAARACAA